ncbi:hypothetical protein NDU88_005771 [Pleurodeles waltl]|uniref:Uncharacterized protein n=1 Tax=Pleurodeles waltl TaxID=8319 RepID=A0AAV7L1V3_PLEWA|nr:hypothetical protein NDU88_005771 [Pleurodeles waltl]
MDRTLFRFCPRCHAKFLYTDQHMVCNLCLSPEHREEDCEACLLFRSKKTLRDRRARRLEMVSKHTEFINNVEEQAQMAVSIQDTDSEANSDQDSQPITAAQHVSTTVPTPTLKRPLRPWVHHCQRAKVLPERKSSAPYLWVWR